MAEQADGPALNNLGSHLYQGNGTEKDIPGAIGYWIRAMTQGSRDARQNLATISGNIEYVESIIAKKLPQKTKVQAIIYCIGRANYLGENVEQNVEFGAEILKRLADDGFVLALCDMGKLEFRRGNIAEAVEYWLKALAKNSLDANKSLAKYSGDIEQVTTILSETISEEKKVGKILYCIGENYLNSKKPAEHTPFIVSVMHKASEAGDADAADFLGNLSLKGKYRGITVIKNEKDALSLFLKAQDNGYEYDVIKTKELEKLAKNIGYSSLAEAHEKRSLTRQAHTALSAAPDLVLEGWSDDESDSIQDSQRSHSDDEVERVEVNEESSSEYLPPLPEEPLTEVGVEIEESSDEEKHSAALPKPPKSHRKKARGNKGKSARGK